MKWLDIPYKTNNPVLERIFKLISDWTRNFIKNAEADFEPSGSVNNHANASTGVHGVGVGVVAAVSDIGKDANLSSSAKDAVSKKHAQGTDQGLDSGGVNEVTAAQAKEAYTKIGYNGTKQVDETNIGDDKIQVYKTASGKYELEDKPTGTGSGDRRDYILIIDEKSAGTDGGTFTAGAWQTRDLNTVKTDTGSHASLSSNQITLAAGTYEAEISCPAKAVLAHQARLRNIADNATTVAGTTECTDLGGKENYSGVPSQAATTHSIIRGRFTIAVSTAFEVQHRCANTCNDYGFGMAVNWDEVETYTTVQFHKVL